MSKAITKASYDAAVLEIRTAMANWFESGVELFLKLQDVEEAGVWRHPGHATFGDFLRAEFPTALGIERYRNVVNAINVYGVERVKQVGIDSCHALTVKALVDDPAKRALVEKGIDNFVKQNGCAPDRNKVRDMIASVAPEVRRPPKEIGEIFASARLEAELKEAKKRILALEKENRELRKKLEKVELSKKSKRKAA